MMDGKLIDMINSLEETRHKLNLFIDRLDLTSNQKQADFVTLFKDLTTGVLASLTSMKEKFDLFDAVTPKLDQVLSQILATTDESGVKVEPNQARYIPKLKLPKFDGEKDDARVWISKCNTFFEFCPMSEQQMLGYASFHMIGHAFKWFMSYADDKGDYLKWNDFTEALINRFSDIKYVDSTCLMREFTELAQCGTVLEYLEKYEDIVIAMNDKFPDIPRSYYVSIFINGLQEEIKMKVKMFQPDTVLEAFRLARICEASLKVQVTEKEIRKIIVVDEALSTVPARGGAVVPNTATKEKVIFGLFD
ncbi:uncharacterized protein LOC124939604 [Impatiens glandulifera]|uniref:uncharacterized protein LOC124939604 n=1 Tax=Impatiens glandulifera TaxID=253017 RepID=UPI001FB0CB3E|nr:uncharacterized protein LOC124939604 [Impatiens glandulifera]